MALVTVSTTKGGVWGEMCREERQEGGECYSTGALSPHGICSIPGQRKEILRCHESQHLMCKPSKSQRKKYLENSKGPIARV